MPDEAIRKKPGTRCPGRCAGWRRDDEKNAAAFCDSTGFAILIARRSLLLALNNLPAAFMRQHLTIFAGRSPLLINHLPADRDKPQDDRGEDDIE